jgi:hypothetical protein
MCVRVTTKPVTHFFSLISIFVQPKMTVVWKTIFLSWLKLHFAWEMYVQVTRIFPRLITCGCELGWHVNSCFEFHWWYNTIYDLHGMLVDDENFLWRRWRRRLCTEWVLHLRQGAKYTWQRKKKHKTQGAGARGAWLNKNTEFFYEVNIKLFSGFNSSSIHIGKGRNLQVFTFSLNK